jgi:hypothetical protein
MTDLTKEQFEQLPDFIKSDYIEVDGSYKHGGFVKVKATADALDKDRKQAAIDRERIERELQDYRQLEQERIEAAKREAYERAKADGNTDELEKRWSEKLQDAQRRVDETERQFKERMKRLADKQRSALAQELAAKYAVEGAEEAFKRLVKSYIEIDAETDGETFLDESGSATSLNRAGFEGELKSNPLFARLIKAEIATSGGGNAKGSSVGGANKKPSEYTEHERVQLFRQNPALFNKLFNGA